MEAANWEKLENIFHSALERPFAERKKYLAQECGGNKGLFAEVEALIDSFEKESYFLEESALEFGFSAIHETTKDKLKNKQIGSYRIEEKIGEGGMGDVYKAADTRLNRRVALKFLSESLENDKTAHRQLMREAQAAAALDHPNICAVHGFEEIEGHSFIVMQFVEGKTLNEALKDRELSLPEFKSIAGQIVSAVAFAHSHNIIHRDLKPGNIMLTNEGQIKILDFGLAKVLQKKSGSATETDGNSHFSQNGMVVGTVAYMSPEQLRGERIDYRSDIFSLGIIFYELLTKENPFKRNSQAETIAALLSNKLPETEEKKSALFYSMRKLLERCLQQQSSDRFQSAAEILIALDTENTEKNVILAAGFKHRFFLKLVLLTVVILGFVTFYIFYEDRLPKRTLAVMPISFDNTQVDKQYVTVELTQGIIDNLSNLSGLKIKTVRSKTVNLQTIEKKLETDAVYDGSIIQRGTELFLLSKLIKTSNGLVIKTDEQKVDVNNLIELRENISNWIISNIKLEVSEEDKVKLSKKDTENKEAMRLYFLGRYYLKRKLGNDVNDAVKAFDKAKELDPAFAKAWAGLADANLSKSIPGVENSIPPLEAIGYARTAARTALQLDNTLSESYNSLGLINARYEWNWTDAENNFRIAIAQDPEFLPAREGLIGILDIQERFADSLEEIKKLKELDLLSAKPDMELAKLYYLTGDYQNMELVINKLLKEFPDNNRIPYLQSYLFLQTGRFEEAVEVLEKLYNTEKISDKIFYAAPLGFAYGKLGKRDNALKIIDDLKTFSGKAFVPAQERAVIYIGLGNYDQAFEMLEKSCKEKYPPFPPLLKDHLTQELRLDIRFEGLKKCANLAS